MTLIPELFLMAHHFWVPCCHIFGSRVWVPCWSSTRSGLGEMSGILPRVPQPEEFADPGFASIPSISAQCTLPSLASLLWHFY